MMLTSSIYLSAAQNHSAILAIMYTYPSVAFPSNRLLTEENFDDWLIAPIYDPKKLWQCIQTAPDDKESQVPLSASASNKG